MGYSSLILVTLSSELHQLPSWHIGKPADVVSVCRLPTQQPSSSWWLLSLPHWNSFFLLLGSGPCTILNTKFWDQKCPKSFLSKATPFQRNPILLILVVRLHWACFHFTAHTILQLFTQLLHLKSAQTVGESFSSLWGADWCCFFNPDVFHCFFCRQPLSMMDDV